MLRPFAALNHRRVQRRRAHQRMRRARAQLPFQRYRAAQKPPHAHIRVDALLEPAAVRRAAFGLHLDPQISFVRQANLQRRRLGDDRRVGLDMTRSDPRFPGCRTLHPQPPRSPRRRAASRRNPPAPSPRRSAPPGFLSCRSCRGRTFFRRARRRKTAPPFLRCRPYRNARSASGCSRRRTRAKVPSTLMRPGSGSNFSHSSPSALKRARDVFGDFFFSLAARPQASD